MSPPGSRQLHKRNKVACQNAGSQGAAVCALSTTADGERSGPCPIRAGGSGRARGTFAPSMTNATGCDQGEGDISPAGKSGVEPPAPRRFATLVPAGAKGVLLGMFPLRGSILETCTGARYLSVAPRYSRGRRPSSLSRKRGASSMTTGRSCPRCSTWCRMAGGSPVRRSFPTGATRRGSLLGRGW